MAIPNLLVVDGVEIKAPSAITWSVQDISSPDAGRTLDGIMHKERLVLPGGQKRKLKLEWNLVKFGAESSTILNAFTPEYVTVAYPDPQAGEVVTKIFYTGDKELKFATWWDGKQLLTSLSFSIIEQ